MSEVGIMEVVSTETPTEIPLAHCEHCGKLLGRTARRKYCNVSCKQANYRNRKLSEVTR